MIFFFKVPERIIEEAYQSRPGRCEGALLCQGLAKEKIMTAERRGKEE